MASESGQVCPTCKGKKVVDGICECNMEWRGTRQDDAWDDCQCTPERECPTCGGSGFVEPAMG